jgi:nicotinamide riboside transporter PnuC
MGALDLAMWAVTAVAIVGTVANVLRKRWGFALWLATDVVLVAHNLVIGQPAQAVLFIVYAGLAAWGWWKWRQE